MRFFLSKYVTTNNISDYTFALFTLCFIVTSCCKVHDECYGDLANSKLCGSSSAWNEYFTIYQQLGCSWCGKMIGKYTDSVRKSNKSRAKNIFGSIKALTPQLPSFIFDPLASSKNNPLLYSVFIVTIIVAVIVTIAVAVIVTITLEVNDNITNEVK